MSDDDKAIQLSNGAIVECALPNCSGELKETIGGALGISIVYYCSCCGIQYHQLPAPRINGD